MDMFEKSSFVNIERMQDNNNIIVNSSIIEMNDPPPDTWNQNPSLLRPTSSYDTNNFYSRDLPNN